MAILRGRLWGQVPLLLTKIKVLVQIRQENVREGEVSGNATKILKWVWQPDCVTVLGCDTQNPPSLL